MQHEQKPRIFVVEDNLVYQELIAMALAPISNDIFFYTMGEDCIEELDRQPLVIILDYNLAGNFTGLDTLQEIRKKNESVYVILFSNQKGLDTSENLAHYGSFDFLEKKEYTFSHLRHMIAASGSR